MKKEKKIDVKEEHDEMLIEDYENSDIVLEVCKSEYENEKTRTDTIDSKLSVIGAIIIGAITLLGLTTDYSVFSDITSQNEGVVAGLICKICLSSLSLLILIASLIILLLCIRTRPYRFVDCFDPLQSEKLLTKKCFYQITIAIKYAHCCNHNRTVNEKRAKLYNHSVILLFIGIVLLTCFLMLKTFM